MCEIYLACGIPCCADPQKEQTSLSAGIRLVAVGLGLVALIDGGCLLLSLSPGISQVGLITGWSLVSAGAFSTLVATAIQCAKKKTPKAEGKLSENDPEIAKQKCPSKDGRTEI